MSSRKRNEFLDVSDSDEEIDRGYDSEDVEESRGAIGGHAQKRRKIQRDSVEDSFSGLSDEDEDDEPLNSNVHNGTVDLHSDGDEGAEEDDDVEAGLSKSSRIGLDATSLKQAERARKAAKRSGVVYISRVPPFMKPHTLKHFLSPCAPKGLGRIFLTPEDHETYSRRKKSGGNKKKSFTDGWVEFVSKKDAKAAVDLLNGGIIGGKKGNFYHDDLWNMRYLKGFKWSHLTEQIANENAERAARMREEIRKTRKENMDFLRQVEMGKRADTDAMKQARREAKGITSKGNMSAKNGPTREFKQRQVKSLHDSEALNQKSSSILQNIF
ncbi:hypothetical protein K431DRAFT_284696 [Polychaeton citri CBS 116435]|uniref:18S rRNA factor 2 n=1 Tax=Polychaeton citri CBS 116435 TaxID=1314669 RepID=A0A9P4Q8Q7_9PEZI|nr:hypothetical protein K431DRAFT_284696 [Polychaeton citri CBS 116435]